MTIPSFVPRLLALAAGLALATACDNVCCYDPDTDRVLVKGGGRACEAPFQTVSAPDDVSRDECLERGRERFATDTTPTGPTPPTEPTEPPPTSPNPTTTTPSSTSSTTTAPATCQDFCAEIQEACPQDVYCQDSCEHYLFGAPGEANMDCAEAATSCLETNACF